jgi:hypothetical protein
MTTEPVSETLIPPLFEPKARMVWIEPEIESLSIDQTEGDIGKGLDGGPPGSDCTKS